MEHSKHTDEPCQLLMRRYCRIRHTPWRRGICVLESTELNEYNTENIVTASSEMVNLEVADLTKISYHNIQYLTTFLRYTICIIISFLVNEFSSHF